LRLAQKNTDGSLIIVFINKVKPSGSYYFPNIVKIHTAPPRLAAPAAIGSNPGFS
jgi:hypothetical protein